jgi:hypothetical protein
LLKSNVPDIFEHEKFHTCLASLFENFVCSRGMIHVHLQGYTHTERNTAGDSPYRSKGLFMLPASITKSRENSGAKKAKASRYSALLVERA